MIQIKFHSLVIWFKLVDDIDHESIRQISVTSISRGDIFELTSIKLQKG